MSVSMIAAGVLFGVVSFPFQGTIRDNGGQPLGKSGATIELRLYETIDRSDALWGRTYSIGLQTNGLFTVEVSDDAGEPIVGLTDSLESVLNRLGTSPFYVGITVPSSVVPAQEMRPRSRVMPLPCAVVAESADGATGAFAVTGTLSAVETRIDSNLVVAATAEASQLDGTGTMWVGGDIAVSNVIVGTGGLTVAGDAACAGLAGGAGLKGKTLSLSGGTLKTSAVEADEVEVKNLVGVTDTVPKGTIVMWHPKDGASVPRDWALCNGQKIGDFQTPDLRDRFIVGVSDGYALGSTAGSETVTLKVKHLPEHQHTVKDNQVGRYTWFLNKNKEAYTARQQYDDAGLYTQEAGGTASHNNLPPYTALAFIIKYR